LTISHVDWGAKIAEMDAQIRKLGGSRVTEQGLATIAGCLRDYPAYLLLSDAAHPSPSDLQFFLKFDQNRNLLGFMYRPHHKDLATFAVYALPCNPIT
jgi:hypothetical protein